ncbi:ABC transporter permease [Pseudogracilibacillus auburnensis]|uniref:ABC transporter permease n=1 Tax=Pseudogracilibacillus auburnensis TaxID=1494959 RepID=UPI001A961B5F|nr:ABC transporter permease [Pseudogracilibacillus auburnensis]MBO1003910.1 ABC transporter permease [Pseudogracilibacillus auburnensis]
MNFLKRGFLSITRKKGKSLILLAVIFILGNLIAGAISIQQATGNVEKNIKERLGAAATVELDYEELDTLSDEEWESIEFEDIDIDLIKKIGELSYVKYYDYSMATHLGSESMESYQGDNEDEEFVSMGPSMDFMLKGINYAPVIDFEEQKGKLIDGRVFTQEEIDNGTSVAIISKKLAEKNNLHVGDTFTLENAVYDYDDETGDEELITSRDVVLEIIGLFEPQSIKENEGDSSDHGMIDFMNIEYQNTVYVSNEIVASENKFNWEEYSKVDEEFAEMIEEEEGSFEYYTPMFVLNSPEDTEAFVEEVTPLLPEFYTVISAADQYDSISGSMESMSKLSKYVLIVAVIATVLITGLVVLLFLRDRKRELGIYLSLGERRGRVVGQILIEVMVVAFIGITISLFSGNLLAGQISDTLMKADDKNSSFEDAIYYSEIHTDLTTEDVLDSYEVNLNSSYIIGFYVIGLLTILISTVIPLIYIVRLNPKKILM